MVLFARSGTASVIRKCMVRRKKLAFFRYEKGIELFVRIQISEIEKVKRALLLRFS